MLPKNTRTCKVCHEEKPIDAFSMNGVYRLYTCKGCKHKAKDKLRNASVEAFLRYSLAGLKHSRKKREDLEFAITVADLVELWEEQEGRCALSGLVMTRHRGFGETTTNASVDRIDPAKGYVRSNIQLVCWQANKMKHTLPQPEFFFWIRQINDTLTRE
jgi:hypothetical protein